MKIRKNRILHACAGYNKDGAARFIRFLPPHLQTHCNRPEYLISPSKVAARNEGFSSGAPLFWVGFGAITEVLTEFEESIFSRAI